MNIDNNYNIFKQIGHVQFSAQTFHSPEKLN